MTKTVRGAIAFLGASVMATQLMGAPAAAAAPFRDSGSLFEQALPVTPAQTESERLLKQIASNAAVASKHAGQVDAFTRVGSALSYETHAAELTAAKEAINAMGSDLQQLRELRPSALAWQQALIDRMEPVVAGLAGHTTAAIEHLKSVI